MIKKILLILLLPINSLYAQSLFEDSKGESSFYLSDRNFLQAKLNTSDESVSVGLNKMDNKEWKHRIPFTNGRHRHRLFGSGEFKIKVKDGLGNLVKEGKVNPGFSFSGYWGMLGRNRNNVNPNRGNDDYTFYLKASLNYDKFPIIDTTMRKVSSFNKLKASADIHFNKRWNFKKTVIVEKNGERTEKVKRVYIFTGASLGIKGATNYDQLSDGKILTTVVQYDSVNIIKSEDGKLGLLTDDLVFPLKTDFAILPSIFDKNIFGFNVYTRVNFNLPKTPVNQGIGIFFASDGQPNNIIGGFAWQLNDVFNSSDIMKGSTVFFYVQYSILGN